MGENRSLEDRMLVLETKYEEQYRGLQTSLGEIKQQLARMADGGIATCAIHEQTLTALQSELRTVKSELAASRRDASESVRRVWMQLWGFVTIAGGAGIGAVIAHITGAL